MSAVKTVIVHKYGGASLETPEKIKSIAASVAKLSAAGNGVIVVVSAMGKTTDGLVNLAYQVSPSPNRRELDMLLSTGERVSMSLMSMALSDLGCRAISFTGSQAGVMTDGSHSNARIVDIRPIRISEELDRGNVIVLAGFQGVNPKTKEITTLGRGGTDTTAVAMAAKFMAARCEIIKEVDGVCTADPQIVPTARGLRRVTFAALREMCFWGAKVLHHRSVALADETHINLFVRRWGSETSVTEVVKENREMEQSEILSVSSHAIIEHLDIGAPTLNRAYALLEEHLAKNQLARPQILASAFTDNVTKLMITGEKESIDTLLRSLNGQSIIRAIKKRLSSVTITSHGAVATDLAAKALSQLERDGVIGYTVLFTPLSISVCVLPSQREAAIRSLHTLIN
jgi:aspartate kinase